MATSNLDQWRAIVTISGDGLFHEVSPLFPLLNLFLICSPLLGGFSFFLLFYEVSLFHEVSPFFAQPSELHRDTQVLNGIFERDDWMKACKLPLGVIPGGTGNGLAR